MSDSKITHTICMFRRSITFVTILLLVLISLIRLNYLNSSLNTIKETIIHRQKTNKTTWPNSISYKNRKPYSGKSLTINSWLRVSDSMYLYSAYLDSRQSRILTPIRIIGLWKVPPKEELRKDPIGWYHIKDETSISPTAYYCQLFYENKLNGKLESSRGVRLTRQIFEEGLKVYAGTFFNCYFNTSTLEKVIGESMDTTYVAVYPFNVEGYPAKLLPVKTIGREAHPGSKDQLAICVRPLFGPMDNLVAITQFLSFYEAQGITHFHFYDMGISGRIRKYLEQLSSSSLSISLSQWNLPTGNWSELWDYGSLAALNDCAYRNMFHKSLVIVVDIDEFMVPQGSSSAWTSESLTTLLTSKNLTDYSEYLVRNTFFCKENCTHPNSDDDFLPILTCFNRTKRIWNAKLRSKYIIRPEHVIQVGHHSVTKFMGDARLKKTYEFPTNQLILHHYRECSTIPKTGKEKPVLNRVTVYDNSMRKYRNKILASVSYRQSKIKFNTYVTND